MSSCLKSFSKISVGKVEWAFPSYLYNLLQSVDKRKSFWWRFKMVTTGIKEDSLVAIESDDSLWSVLNPSGAVFCYQLFHKLDLLAIYWRFQIQGRPSAQGLFDVKKLKKFNRQQLVLFLKKIIFCSSVSDKRLQRFVSQFSKQLLEELEKRT